MSPILKSLALATLTLALTACGNDSSTPTATGPAAATTDKTVTILWAKWAPADALQKLGEDYKAKTGVAIKVDQKPWSADGFAATKQQEFNNKGTTYDIIIGDSQWIGQGVVGGHYADLTGLIKDNPDLFGDVAPAALSFYAEYPKASGKFYAVPCESDAMACVYRKDLFEDPKHQAAYKKFVAQQPQDKPLPVEYSELAVPKTWGHLILIARYFKEAAGIPNMAGIVMPTTRGYDQATMSYEPLLWSYGGDWGDQTKNTITINSPEALTALKDLQTLVHASTEGGRDMDYGDVAKTYVSGNAAMAMTFFAFFPTFASVKENPDFAGKTGYFNVPAGPHGRFTALGGQGMSLNNHVDDARKEQAIAFMRWFSTPDVQKKWAQLGGYTANTKILSSEDFKNATPYNPLFAEAFGMMKDFWNIPEYDQLLDSAQKQITTVLQTDFDPAAALQALQAEHEKVMKNRGN